MGCPRQNSPTAQDLWYNARDDFPQLKESRPSERGGKAYGYDVPDKI